MAGGKWLHLLIAHGQAIFLYSFFFFKGYIFVGITECH